MSAEASSDGPTGIKLPDVHIDDPVAFFKRYKQTDTGNALVMKEWFGDRLFFVPAFKARGWFVWNGRFWEQDDTLRIVRLAKFTVRGLQSVSLQMKESKERLSLLGYYTRAENITVLERMVRSLESEVAKRPQELDADPMLLCVENGTLDLKHGTSRRRHAPGDLITLMAPVEWRGTKYTHSLWEEFLDRFVRKTDGMEEFLQRAAFASFTGTTEDKAFLYLHDDHNGDTGKTTFTRALMAALGPYATTVDAEAFLTKGTGAPGIPAQLAMCAGKRMVVSGEVPEGRHIAASLMKKITQGGGRMTFERKYENPWEGLITFTVWLDGNSIAKAPAEDTPLFKRWRLTPFLHVIPPAARDEGWTDRAVASPDFRAAVLAWVMRGRKGWSAVGIGTAPAVEEAVKNARDDMDPLAEFWEEVCSFGEGRFVASAALRGAYTDWCAGRGVHPMSEPNFNALLKSRAEGLGMPVRNLTQRLDGRPVRGWAGVAPRAVEPHRVGGRTYRVKS